MPALLVSSLLVASLVARVAQGPSDQERRAPDSARVLKAVRAAQARFEEIRRANLRHDPHDQAGRCDNRIGRFCYWYQPGDFPPPPEAAEIVQGREELLATLQEAADWIPGDEWIAGQRVRYLVEQRRPAQAADIATECVAPRAWCAALLGLARHAMGDYRGADAAFDQALALMPEPERCRWLDLADIVPDLPRSYRDLPCQALDSADRRFWWLADPLYSLPGNDRRTEHLARLAMIRVLERSATPHRIGWGQDEGELVLRYGWPVRWTVGQSQPGNLGSEPVLGHEAAPSYDFLPPSDALDSVLSPQTIEWHLADRQAFTRYAPPYAPRFGEIDQVQFARFRRGDSTLVVAAFDLTFDTLFRGRAPSVVLAASRDPGAPIAIGPRADSMLRGVAAVRSAGMPAVLSLEASDVGNGLAARRRVVSDTGGLHALSDLLLLRPRYSASDSLEQVLAAALQGTVVRPAPLALYWEEYGPSGQGPTEVSMIVVKTRLHHREAYPAGHSECLPRQGPAISLRWIEPPPAGPSRSGRSVVLDLSNLREGTYQVGIELRPAAGPPACTSREVRVDAKLR